MAAEAHSKGAESLARGKRERWLRWIFVAATLPFLLVACQGLAGIPSGSSDEATQWYIAATPHDVVTRLQSRMDSGQTVLAYDPERGYLPAALKALDVPVSSQMLVFSKTSVQKDLISPTNPRALYFNDHVYVGYVPGGKALEIAANDPRLGPVYYVLLQRPVARPLFFRSVDACLKCHKTSTSGGLPEHFMRSVYVDEAGTPYPHSPVRDTMDASPFRERWGGWYVTGTCGSQKHLGNCLAHRQGVQFVMDSGQGANRADLRSSLNVSAYLSPYSDIVALMVLGHQTHLQNLILKAGYETARTKAPIPSVCEPLVRALLFSGEAPLTAPVVGSSGFAQQFAALGPRDRRGRSLRAFDLKKRLFRYPCSYTIYSDAFDALPTPAKKYIYRRLWEVLTGRDRSDRFAYLSERDRKGILGILLDTKPDFAAWGTRQFGTERRNVR